MRKWTKGQTFCGGPVGIVWLAGTGASPGSGQKDRPFRIDRKPSRKTMDVRKWPDLFANHGGDARLGAPTQRGRSAPTARSIPAWASGPGCRCTYPRSPVGARHSGTMGRAFSPFGMIPSRTRAVGPGWYGSGPLALVAQMDRPFAVGPSGLMARRSRKRDKSVADKRPDLSQFGPFLSLSSPGGALARQADSSFPPECTFLGRQMDRPFAVPVGSEDGSVLSSRALGLAGFGFCCCVGGGRGV
jgi:hypothetical protein